MTRRSDHSDPELLRAAKFYVHKQELTSGIEKMAKESGMGVTGSPFDRNHPLYLNYPSSKPEHRPLNYQEGTKDLDGYNPSLPRKIGGHKTDF